MRGDVLRRAARVAIAGAGVGLAATLGLSRFFGALLVEVSPTDPVSLMAAAAVLLAVGGVAAYVPARRATRVDPVEALRAD